MIKMIYHGKPASAFSSTARGVSSSSISVVSSSGSSSSTTSSSSSEVFSDAFTF